MRLRLRRFYAGKWDEGTVIINGNPEARFSGVILGSPSGGGSIGSVFCENGDRDLEKRLVFLSLGPNPYSFVSKREGNTGYGADEDISDGIKKP